MAFDFAFSVDVFDLLSIIQSSFFSPFEFLFDLCVMVMKVRNYSGSLFSVGLSMYAWRVSLTSALL